MKNNELRVGVVGYCPPTRFDEVEAKRMLREAYDLVERNFSDKAVTVVSGLTNVGVLKLAYEEAKKRGWKTAGVSCKKARDFEWFPVDEDPIIVGENWGDESNTFVYGTKVPGHHHENGLDAMVRIGLGEQSLREAFHVKELGKPVYGYDLPAIK